MGYVIGLFVLAVLLKIPKIAKWIMGAIHAWESDQQLTDILNKD